MRLCLIAGVCTFHLVGVVPSAVAQSDGSQVTTLDWAISQARQHNPRLAASRAVWQAAIEQTPQARSLEPPGLYTMFWAVPDDTPNPVAAREVWFGIKQSFPYPGKLDLRGRLADTSAEIAHQHYLDIEEELVRQVSNAYFDLYLIDKETGITGQHLELARRFADIAQTRYAAGSGEQGAVLKSAVEVSDLAHQASVLTRRRQAAVARLNALLDRDPASNLGPPAEFVVAPVVQSLDELQHMALENRAELRAARQAIVRSDLAIDLARRDRYPDFMTDFSYWNVRDMPNRWMLMVEARLPISLWSRARYDARQRQAEVEREIRQEEQASLEGEVLDAVTQAYVGLNVAADNIDVFGRIVVPQARQAMAAVEAGYRTDRESFLNLVDSERQLLRYELDYHRARVDYEKSVADLERAVGMALRPEGGE